MNKPLARAVMILTALGTFSYILHSGYYFDDSFESLTAARLRFYHLGFFA